jgi:hypothetical protein
MSPLAVAELELGGEVRRVTRDHIRFQWLNNHSQEVEIVHENGTVVIVLGKERYAGKTLAEAVDLALS